MAVCRSVEGTETRRLSEESELSRLPLSPRRRAWLKVIASDLKGILFQFQAAAGQKLEPFKEGFGTWAKPRAGEEKSGRSSG
jgi:hypothetical protein